MVDTGMNKDFAKSDLLFTSSKKLKKILPLCFLMTVAVVWSTEYLLHDYMEWDFLEKHDAYEDLLWVFITSIINLLVVMKIISKPLSNASKSEDEILASFVNGFEDERERKKQLNKYFDSQKKLDKLTTAHLKNIVEETDTAADRIIGQAQDIDSSMDDLNKTIDRFHKESDELAEQSQSTIENNKENIDSLSEYVEKRVKDLEEDQQRGNALLENASTMSKLIDLISDIADRTNLLALNASIEAARAGEQGKSFAVVAGEVRKLSTQSEEAAAQINKAVNGMIDEVEKQFSDKLTNDNINNEKKLLANLEVQLTSLGISYGQLDGFKQEILDQVDSISKNVAQKVMELLANIQFQDITRQQIEQVISYLSDIDDYVDYMKEITNENENKISEKADFNLDHIFNNYVMKQQRDIHNEIENGNKGHEAVEAAGGNSGSAEEEEEEIIFF